MSGHAARIEAEKNSYKIKVSKSSRKWRDDTKMDLWINVVWIECVEFRPGVAFSAHRNGVFRFQ